jgi:hypothetical protein
LWCRACCFNIRIKRGWLWCRACCLKQHVLHHNLPCLILMFETTRPTPQPFLFNSYVETTSPAPGRLCCRACCFNIRIKR